MGCHSTMDRPERVRRVTPPTTTMQNSSAQQARSQAAIWASERVSGAMALGIGAGRELRSAGILRSRGGPDNPASGRGYCNAAKAVARIREGQVRIRRVKAILDLYQVRKATKFLK